MSTTTRTLVVPQYATSTDPTVIRTIRGNQLARDEWHKAAFEFAESLGGYAFVGGSNAWDPDLVLRAVAFEKGTEPTRGRWKKEVGQGIRFPFKNDPIREEMAEMTVSLAPIPGMVMRAEAPNEGGGWGSKWIMSPNVFVHGGAAWAGFGHLPTDSRGETHGPQWTECRPSEYMRAVEDLPAALETEATS